MILDGKLDKLAAKIAKAMLAEFNEKNASGESSFRVKLVGAFNTTTYCNPKGSRRVFTYGDIEIPYIERKDDLRDFANAIRQKFMEKAQKKLKKGVLLFHKTKEYTQSSYWSFNSYEVWDGIIVVRPCKEYSKLTKKFEALGLEKLDPLKWNATSVFGKRSSYHATDIDYRCTSPKHCLAVLDFLKGRKKASYEYKRHESLEDREYGERYETEWSGAIYNTLLVKTADSAREFGW